MSDLYTDRYVYTVEKWFMDINDKKRSLRNEVRVLKRQFKEQLPRQSAVVADVLCSHARILAARNVALYSPLSDEVDVSRLSVMLYNSQRGVFFPQVVGDGEMVFRRYDGEGSLHNGAFGINEPAGDILDDLSLIDVIIVPGMAFDAHGNRLGRGKGFYDRSLSSMPGAYKIGVCFDFQFFESIPCGPYDIRMDEVIHP